MTTRILIVSLTAACLLLVAGAVIDPSFVAGHLSKDGELERATIAKILTLRLMATSLGALLGIGSVWLYWPTAGKYLLLPLLATYFLVVHSVYINPKYPTNTFLQSGTFAKFWDVLLGQDLFLTDFEPKSLLRTKKHEILQARYPVINVHVHFTYWLEKLSLEEMINIMDECRVAMAVDLDGWPPGETADRIKAVRTKYRGRFMELHHVWFPEGEIDESFMTNKIARFEKAVQAGARGLKIWRNLGLKTTDLSGKVIPVDDPRLDALWTKAGELEVPVLIHVGDPDATFLPIDRFNERFEQLREKNDRLGLGSSYVGPGFPAKTAILQQFENIVRKHPNTIFIGAHMAELAEDLQHLSSLLDRYPNLYVDISAQAAELGRQPYTSRQFFIRYQDRLLFGTDGNPRERDYRAYFRFLETADEYFDYPFSEVETFGRWKIYGLFLPQEVLAKVYYKNATRLLRLKDQELAELLKLMEGSAREPRTRRSA